MPVPAIATAMAVVAGFTAPEAMATTRFAPPLDRPLIVTIERVETREGASRVYRAEREIVFRRDGDGFRAEVTMRAATGDPGIESAAMFAAGTAALAGRTIVFHLNSDGAVVRIEDSESVWADFCRGLIATIVASKGGTPEARDKLAARLIGPLMAIPAEQRFARLASLLDPLIVDAEGVPAEGTAPVQVPTRSPYGGQLMFDGTRTVAHVAGGQTIATQAQGEVPIPDGSEARARIAVTMLVTIDGVTGLVTRRIETVQTRIGEGAAMRVMESRTTTELREISPLVS